MLSVSKQKKRSRLIFKATQLVFLLINEQVQSSFTFALTKKIEICLIWINLLKNWRLDIRLEKSIDSLLIQQQTVD